MGRLALLPGENGMLPGFEPVADGSRRPVFSFEVFIGFLLKEIKKATTLVGRSSIGF
jgi:hypothetical protein